MKQCCWSNYTDWKGSVLRFFDDASGLLDCTQDHQPLASCFPVSDETVPSMRDQSKLVAGRRPQ
jgi:hypothetical protein